MTYKLYFNIAGRIILLFTCAILFTFIPNELRSFFGDIPCKENGVFRMDRDYCWGARHYWYYWMMFLLFILSLISLILQIKNLIKKYHK
jgi:putative component of toxin-antitoxin plasmid stabilization module